MRCAKVNVPGVAWKDRCRSEESSGGSQTVITVDTPSRSLKILEERNGKKVAVVGSGPTGLTCAFHLAKAGYKVKIFEAQSTPGGMLTLGIPAYRLPKDVVARDIKNVTALGVEIETGVRVENLAELKSQGFEAVFVAAGLQGACQNEDCRARTCTACLTGWTFCGASTWVRLYAWGKE